MLATLLNGRVRALLAAALVLLLAGAAVAQGRVRPMPPRPFPPLAAEITAVQPAGPAYRAGLEVGDQIHEVDGSSVRSLPELRRLLQGAEYSARLTVRCHRTGKMTTVYVFPDDGRIGIDARMVEAYPYGRYPY